MASGHVELPPTTPPLLLATGVKHDAGKPRWDLIPPEPLEGAARVFGWAIDQDIRGDKAYAPRNWEGGMTYGRLFRALMSHLWAWWGKGEWLDDESGLPHLDHALCCIFMLRATVERRPDLDDRSDHAKDHSQLHRDADLIGPGKL